MNSKFFIKSEPVELFYNRNQGAVGKSHAESGIALRAIPDMASRERVARRSDVEVEEASVLSWENSIQTSVKEELFALSPEVSLQFA